MLSRRVDLTLHRDFLKREPIRLSYVKTDADEENMSLDEYKHVVYREAFFGKVRHQSIKPKAFDYDRKYMEEWRDKCICCGATIRIPWRKFYDLCENCDKRNNLRYPWQQKNAMHIDDRNPAIFNLR